MGTHEKINFLFPKLKVAGSNPVSRSNNNKRLAVLWLASFLFR